MSNQTVSNAANSDRANSSRNAVKHGLTSTNFCLLADEDQKIFEEYRDSIEQALAPRNIIEAVHVARIVETSWMIFRISLMEAKAISVQMDLTKRQLLGDHPASTNAADLKLLGGEFLCFQALEQLDTKSNLLDKLNRYRTTHERSFHRCLNALQKLRGPSRPLLDALPSTCLDILNGTQTIFDLKPPAPLPIPTAAPTPTSSPAPKPAPESARISTSTPTQAPTPAPGPAPAFAPTPAPNPAPAFVPTPAPNPAPAFAPTPEPSQAPDQATQTPDSKTVIENCETKPKAELTAQPPAQNTPQSTCPPAAVPPPPAPSHANLFFA